MKTAIRLLALVLLFVILTQFVACRLVSTVTDKTKNVAGNIAEKTKDVANSTKDKTTEWFSNIDLSIFKDGWNTASEFVGSTYAAVATSQFTANVSDAIATLGKNINSAYGSARGVAQEAGFAAEKWMAGTFNIDAIARGSKNRADTPHSTELGSADVVTNYGEQASLKYYSDGSSSAKAQATTLLEAYKKYKSTSNQPLSLAEYMDKHGYDYNSQNDLLASVYNGQSRIIPVDQYEEAVDYLHNRIDKLTDIEGSMAKGRAQSYQETLDNLKTKLTAPDGTSSKEISYDDMQAIAELSQKGEFKPEDFGVTMSQAIPPAYVVKQAVGTGLEAGVIRTILTIGPDIYDIVSTLIKEKNIDENTLKEVGIDGVVSFGEGFVEGAVSSAIVTLCANGVFGEVLTNIDPIVVGTLVVLVIEAIILGFSVANKTITMEEYGCLMFDKIAISLLAIPTTIALAAILPATKICMLIGCFAGAMIACLGYFSLKSAVLTFADGGGFEAIVPQEIKDGIASIKDKISDLNIEEHISNLKDCAVSTVKDGFVAIKRIVSHEKD